jgi:undecaprenyl-diphosphatase
MHPVRHFDYRYTADIKRIPSKWRPLILVVSLLGEPVLIVCSGLVIWMVGFNRHDQQIKNAAVYAGGAYTLNIALKLILHRRRPRGRVVRTFGLRSYSFPSGHAFGSVILYGLLAYIISAHLGRAWVVVLSLVGVWLVLSIGVARVYLGSHFPSDVLAGWLLGAVSLIAVLKAAF